MRPPEAFTRAVLAEHAYQLIETGTAGPAPWCQVFAPAGDDASLARPVATEPDAAQHGGADGC